MKQHKLTFLPDKKSGYFDHGITLRDAALELGIVIESSCGGFGNCGKCRILINEGTNDQIESEALPVHKKEADKGLRLSCKALLLNDMVCTVPEESRSMKEQIMTEGISGMFILDPDIKKIFLNLPEPSVGQKYFDMEMVIKTLEESGISVQSYDFNLTRNISHILRENNYKITAVVDRNALIAVEGEDTTDVLYGVAIDIGTTTIALKLINIISGEVCAVGSALNKQQHFGADVISRINYIIDNPDGLEKLHKTVTGQINHLIKDLCREVNISTNEVYKVIIAGNTIMQHICLNIDPRNVAFSPYTPVVQSPGTISSKELGISINDAGRVYFLPNLGSYVGSDITSVLTVLDLEESDKIRLVVDIGTNGEIVLGSKEKLLCCSSPAGPAWEGACIKNGMRAATGAVELAEIEDGDLKIKTIGNVVPVGICGSGLHDLVTALVRSGVIDIGGRILNKEELSDDMDDKLKNRIIKRKNGINDFMVSDNGVELTQKDIREVQLAKGAIAAGISILMKELKMEVKDIAEIFVAGAFGNHLKGIDAVDMGMLPAVSEENIKFIGNAALSGAEAVLLSSKAREKAENLINVVNYIEVSGREDFQDTFINSMLFTPQQ